MPRYQLSNVRLERDRFQKQVILIDWKRIQDGAGKASIAGRTSRSRFNITFNTSIQGNSGTERLQQLFTGFGVAKDYEFWVETSGPPGRRFVISNFARIGNPGPTPKMRVSNAKDISDWDEQKRVNSPPPLAPVGHVIANANTVLVPGMQVKAGWMGDWMDAEVIAINNQSVTVKYPATGNKMAVRTKTGWIAVAPAMARKAITHPNAFRPSANVFPGTTTLIPMDAKLVSDTPFVAAGTPVSFSYLNKIEHGFVTKTNSMFVWIRQPNARLPSDKMVPKNQAFLASSEIAAQLRADEKSNTSRVAGNSQLASLRLKDYEPRKPPAFGFTAIPEQLKVPSGSIVKAYWGSKWYDLTVLGESVSGPVPVRWDSFGSAWDCRIKREQLLIANSALKPSSTNRRDSWRRPATDNPFEPQPERNSDDVREWKDSTGRFSVQAKFVDVVNENALLNGTDGKVIRIPLAKLSATDRRLAEKFANEKKENPFEVIEP